MEYLLLFSIIILFFPITLTDKLCSNGTSEKIILFKFSFVRAFLGVIIGGAMLLCNKSDFKIDIVMCLASISFGVMLATCLLLNFYAMQVTTVAITSMFTSASVIVPICVGVILFNDSITFGKAAGLFLFFVAALLIVEKSTYQNRRFGKKAFLACMGVLITSGLGSVSIQFFANYSSCKNETLFMFLSYIVETILLFIVYKILSNKMPQEEKKQTKIENKLLIYGAIGTVATFLAQQFQTSIAAVMPATILFPITMGSRVIMGVVVGWAFFKERLSVKNVIGVILGVLSLIMINSY